VATFANNLEYTGRSANPDLFLVSRHSRFNTLWKSIHSRLWSNFTITWIGQTTVRDEARIRLRGRYREGHEKRGVEKT